MGKKFLCLTSIAALLSLSSCFFDFLGSKEDLDQEDQYSYSDLPQEKEITIEDLFNQEEDFYMVYCFNQGCPICSSFKSYIIPYFLDNPEVPLYYLNLTFIDPSYYQDDENLDNTIGVSSIDEFYFYTTPGLVGLKAHQVIFNIYGISEITGILDYFI